MFKMNKKGFTLVELLVVLAILGLLAGIGIPQYLNTLERSREAADNAIILVVQSAVDGYMAETGVGVTDSSAGGTPLQMGSSGLNVAANSKSMLTDAVINFRDFLDEGHKDATGVILPPKTAFKSKTYREAPEIEWQIDALGKVTVHAATTPSGT